MTNANYIQWLETMILGCDDLGGMEREKAIYQNCLKKARNLGQTLPIQRVSNSLLPCGFDKCVIDIEGDKMCDFCKYKKQ